MPAAWAALARLRKMTSADRDWLKGAEQSAASGLAPLDEADLRYAIGKYYDDTDDFGRAFHCYQRANELNKTAAEPYDRDAWTRTVDDLIRIYTREALARVHQGSADSERPVFVVGMPRSGTSLVEQIIASHPSAKGAGELDFWAQAFRRHDTALRRELPGEALTRKLASGYLRTLDAYPADVRRVVDKTTFNADLMGVIHCAFPRARFIYLRRDPIDSCLSC
jgi:tetratricopeptide (TPR) repeat protein